jgi:GxxExxY protein
MKTEIYKVEGYKLMGGAFEVYDEQGYGLTGEIYQEGLEMESRAISCRSRQELKKRYRPDVFVFESLIVELKSVSQLLPEPEAQLVDYMRITKPPVRYPVNFGHEETREWKRFMLSEFIKNSVN